MGGGQHAVRIEVGCLVTFVGTCVLAGGIQNALGVMAMSVICTAGVGLLFWLPLVYVSGWIVVSLFQLVTGGYRLTDEPAPRPQDIAMKRFIHQAKVHALTEEELVARLRRSGWSEEEVQHWLEARRQLDRVSPQAGGPA